VLQESEPVAADSDGLPPIGNRSDREAAHYYRSMHARSVEREQRWKERALAAEQIIKQLLVLLGWCVQEILQLKGRLAWLNKQQFGSKSEATPASPRADEQATTSEPNGSEEQLPGKRRRGQQPGGKGPKRQRRRNLPEQITHHTLREAERTCAICGAIRPETGLTEESEEVEWKVCVVRHRHIRHRYGPSCHCPSGRGMVTAPKPAKLIPKGLFAISFWVQVLLKKFAFQQPLQRTVRELEAYELKVSPGTLTGGLQKIQPMLQALAGQLVLRARQGNRWHMYETGWPMLCLPEGKARQRWWAWVVVGREATAFLLEPSRSAQVPQNFFPHGTEGILNSDRFRAYFGLLRSDWKIKLAYCWSHQRRDFVNLSEGWPRLAWWAEQWVGLINQLFALNGQRRQAWSKKQTELFNALDQQVRQQVEQIRERVERELASGKLVTQPEKVLQSLRRHWAALTVFVDHPEVPMDNNAAERALRPLAVARKNFYGSRSEWSGALACACFTLLATLRQHGICPRRYLQEYLEACARNGGKAPEKLDEFLPWKWSAEKRAAWAIQEHPP